MNIKKIISLFSALSALICILCACEPEDSETPADTTTAAEETEPPVTEKLVLIENGKTDFKVIRSENAEGYYLETATTVYQKLKTGYSSDFKFGEDWINPLEPDPAVSHEILLFDTIRDESKAALEDLSFDGYIIRVTDCKIVIVGSGFAQCNAALSYFFDTLIPENTADGIISFTVGLEVKKEMASEAFDLKTAIESGKSIGAHITERFHYPVRDGFHASQGATNDGKYAYITVKKEEDGVETDKILKVDMSSWEVVAISEELELDHANDMTYDPVRNQLVVVHMLHGLISFINTDTLTIETTVHNSAWASSLEYVVAKDQYILRNYNNYVITDKDLNHISSLLLNGYPEEADKYIGQGMYADENFLYIPKSGTASTNNNIILIFDHEGKWLTTVNLATKMESETIFFNPTDGNFYINFSRSATTVCLLEFYEVFE